MTLWMDESYRLPDALHRRHAPDVNRRSLAVEPMTCPPNAFRSGDGADPARAGRVRVVLVGHLAVVSGNRPRVLILGGGFAGVGAAQKLEHADADVVLVDRHDYHTFQPLLYQLATGLLETTAVGHSLRDLLERHGETTVHKATVTAVDLDAREVQLRRPRADRLRLPRLRARSRGQLLRDRGRAPSTRSRCTRCRTRSASRTTCSSAGRPPTATRAWSRTAR